nr:PREDICTED: transmembrane protein 131 [Bemisia tabaci]
METIAAVYLFLFVTLELFLVKSQVFSSSENHDFNNDLDVKVLVNGIPVIIPKEFSASSQDRLKDSGTDAALASSIQFQPPSLDFKERHLGIPHHEKVTIINLSPNKTIRMSSISGSTVHFHSSFFEDKLIPPLGNTTFNVVFLGREEGEVESSLFIHTSIGSLKYQVRGISIQSPYRLRPLSGIRLPLNASFSPLINLHNPFSTPIQLVEVFSSGGDFHLELPSGELEGPKQLWEIPAFYTKPVIRVKFNAHTQKNHTAYIRLKVNRSEEVLIVPLEVEVSPSSGIYSPDDIIDFGIGGHQDPPKTLLLHLKNSWKKPIKIQNIMSIPPSKALKIDFQPIKVPPDSQTATKVASLTFDWKLAQDQSYSKGKLVIKSSGVGGGVEKLVMSYIARTLHGGLVFDVPAIEFQPLNKEFYQQPFHIKNTFALPVVILNVTVPREAAQQIQIINFEPIIIMPGEKVPLFTLDLVDSSEHFNSLNTEITIHSNVSSVKIPLLRYSGHLMKVTESGDDLVIGTIEAQRLLTTNVGLVNLNPAPVKLQSWGSDLAAVSVELLGTCAHSLRCISQSAICKFTDTKTIESGHQAVLKVTVKTEKPDEVVEGDVWVESEFERLSFALQMKVVDGKIKVINQPVKFSDCFPEQSCSIPLEISSEFNFPMNVVNVSHTSLDASGISFSPEKEARIDPMTTSIVGQLVWKPPEEAFQSLLHNSTETQEFLASLSLPLNVAEWDLHHLNSQRQQFRTFFSQPLNFSLRLDTTEIRRHLFLAQLPLSWPVMTQKTIEFPLTLIGNQTFRNLTLINFSSRQPVVVQIAPFVLYKDYLENERELSEFFNFTNEALNDPSQFSVSVEDSLIWDYPNAHRASILYLIPPASNLTLSICFSPSNAESIIEYIAIRNNLTTLELVKLHGLGTEVQFKFGNRKPGSDSPLLFEITEKHLKDCEKDKNQKDAAAPNLTVKRTFTARNTGELPILILGYLINGLPTEGYGFKVLNPEPFVLLSNTTRKVDIAFTPDFTLARIERTLTIITDMSIPTNYTLVATLPTHMLAPCSAVIKRPAWEPLLYYIVLTLKLTLLACVIVAAFLESERLLKSVIIRAQDAAIQPVLDLKSVAEKDIEEKINYSDKSSTKEGNKPPAISLDESYCDPSSQSSSWFSFPSSFYKEKSDKEKVKTKSSTNSTSNSTLKRRTPTSKNSESTSWSSIFNATSSSLLNMSSAPKVKSEPPEQPVKVDDNSKISTPKVNGRTNHLPSEVSVQKKAAASNKKTKSKSKKEGKIETSLTKKNLEEWNSSSSSPSSTNSSCHEKEFKKTERSLPLQELRDQAAKLTPKQAKVDKPLTNGVVSYATTEANDDSDKKKPKVKVSVKVAKPGHKKTNSLDLTANFENAQTKKVKTVLTNVKSLPLARSNKGNFVGPVSVQSNLENGTRSHVWEDNKAINTPKVTAWVPPLPAGTPFNYSDRSQNLKQSKPMRLSFSDVVARSDNRQPSNSAAYHKREKAFDFSVPPPEPIGPKKSTNPASQMWGNSLFSSVPPFSNVDKVWDQSIVLKMIEEERIKKETLARNALIDSWPKSIPSLWSDAPSSSLHTGSPLSNAVWSNSSPTRSSVWGSDVWAPPAASTPPRTPLRPPPGLAPTTPRVAPSSPLHVYPNLASRQRIFDEGDIPLPPSYTANQEKSQPKLSQTQEYDPFRSLSSIWSSPSPSPSPSIWSSNPSQKN